MATGGSYEYRMFRIVYTGKEKNEVHVYTPDGKFEGVYATEKDAEEAVDYLLDREYPSGVE